MTWLMRGLFIIFRTGHRNRHRSSSHPVRVLHVPNRGWCSTVRHCVIISKVNFTGSTRVGSIIGALCGKYIKPVVLELGGAAALIVLEDADIEHAVKSTLLGKFLHSGEICMATNNVLGNYFFPSNSSTSCFDLDLE